MSILFILASFKSIGQHIEYNIIKNYPACFIENKGQITDQYGEKRDDIQFKVSATSGLNVFIGNGAMHFQYFKPMGTKIRMPKSKERETEHCEDYEMYRMDVELVGANERAAIITEGKPAYYETYYTSCTAGNSFTAKTYQKITYKNIYHSIDWVLYFKNNRLEYDFIIHPGGNSNDIKLRYTGAEQLTNSQNALTAITPMGTISQGHLYCYEAETGKEVNAGLALHNNLATFATEKYAGTLVIDPTLAWGTYFGYTDAASLGTACDRAGNVYLTGNTGCSSNIATTGAYQTIYGGGGDVYLAKFAGNGSLLWATYFGGDQADEAYAICCDDTGNVFISGYTRSASNIATPGAYQATIGDTLEQIYIAKFNNSGRLDWATYYGGNDMSICYGAASDHLGNVYIAGGTHSHNNIATPGAYQDTPGGGADAFLAKFSGSGQLLWATYFGSKGEESANDVACDKDNNVFMTGTTMSRDHIATAGAYQTSPGSGPNGHDFLAKFNSSGAMQWATYYGGNGVDAGRSVACDESGNVYITGNTSSTDSIATPGTFLDHISSGFYGYLAKFSNDGNRLWGTYYGPGNDPRHVVSDGENNIYIAGSTSGNLGFATSDAYQGANYGNNAFLAQFSGNGSLVYGTFYGGMGGTNECFGAASDHHGNVYISGYTNSRTLIATPGAFDTSYLADRFGDLAYLAKFDSFPVPNSVHQVNLNEISVSVYPNPAKDKINVAWANNGGIHPLSGTEDNKICILTMEGQEVYITQVAAAANHAILPVDMLAAGVYICVVKNSIGRWYGKFNVVR